MKNVNFRALTKKMTKNDIFQFCKKLTKLRSRSRQFIAEKSEKNIDAKIIALSFTVFGAYTIEVIVSKIHTFQLEMNQKR